MTLTSPDSSMSRTLNSLKIIFTALVISIILITAYLIYIIADNQYFTWSIFSLLLLFLTLLNLCLLYKVWPNRRNFSPRLSIFLIDCLGVGLWYWTLSPQFQFLTIHFNVEQLRLDAFAFIWEVTIFGSLLFIYNQIKFSPINKYLRQNSTQNPEDIYTLISQFHKRVAIRTILFTIIGYGIGTWQLQYFTHLPNIEAIKEIIDGVTLSLFLALFYYLAYGYYLGPFRTKIRDQYKLKNRSVSFFRKSFAVITFVSLGSILLLIVIYIQALQQSTINLVQNNSSQQISNSTLSTNNSVLNLGSHGKFFIINNNSKLPINNVAPSTKTALISTQDGVVIDNDLQQKLIIIKPYGLYRKKVGIVYLNDFYKGFTKPLETIIGGVILVIIVTLCILYVFNKILTDAIRILIKGVHSAINTGKYQYQSVNSADEFEELSIAFESFIDKTNESNLRVISERARMKAAIEGITLGFAIINKAGEIVIKNSSLDEMFNKSLSTIYDLDELIKDKDLNKICKDVALSQKSLDITNVSYDAKILRIFVAPVISIEGDVSDTVLLIEDITEESVLARSRDEFFSIASHELRTPLTAIKGNTSMLLEYYKVIMKDKDVKEMVTDIHDSSQRLIEIVNDFLDVSRIEQGRMKFDKTPFQIVEIVSEVVHELAPNIKDKKLKMDFDQASYKSFPDVCADPARIKQIVYNLVGNAIKFTEVGKITITISRQDSNLKISVSDSGRGIPLTSQKLLFHKFQQAGDSLLTRDTTKGTGLGLYISKIMIESMDGKIYLEKSVPDEGSTFSFTIPLAN